MPAVPDLAQLGDCWVIPSVGILINVPFTHNNLTARTTAIAVGHWTLNAGYRQSTILKFDLYEQIAVFASQRDTQSFYKVFHFQFPNQKLNFPAGTWSKAGAMLKPAVREKPAGRVNVDMLGARWAHQTLRQVAMRQHQFSGGGIVDKLTVKLRQSHSSGSMKVSMIQSANFS
jgi:hypothetical protein